VTPHFFKAISYNAVNIFLYKIILQLHQTALFFTISATMFGLIGTLFSSIYFLISITNIGFDYFIITHHASYTASQKNFKKLIPIFIVRLITVLLVIVSLWVINYYYKLCPVSNILDHTTPQLLIIMVLIFISETIKKSLDALAQMSFLQRSISIFDISTLLIYVAFVWGSYFISHQISLFTIFIPMAFISILECYLLTHALISFYHRLPLEASGQVTPVTKVIIVHQLINYINQIAKALFSPNFFIIVLACHFGLSKAGQIKIFTDTIVLLYMVLNRSFGLPTAALFSSMAKQVDSLKNPIDSTQGTFAGSLQIFAKVTNWYIQFLYALGFIIIALLFSCYAHHDSFSVSILYNVILFIFAGFMEYLLIAYEKWYLTQNKSWILAIINGINLAMYALLFLVSSYIPNNFILLPIILFRTAIVASIIYITHRIWNIVPSFRIHTWTIVITATICSTIFIVQFLISL
jgi:hypothetical protein